MVSDFTLLSLCFFGVAVLNRKAMLVCKMYRIILAVFSRYRPQTDNNLYKYYLKNQITHINSILLLYFL